MSRTIVLSDAAAIDWHASAVEIQAAIENSTAAPAIASVPASSVPQIATWTSPKTGHVIPLPQPGELLPGYALRVAVACGATAERAAQMNGVFFQSTSNFHMYGDGTMPYWAGIADEGYNRDAYQTDAEKAETALQNANTAAAFAVVKPGSFPAATATLADANFLLAVDPYYRAHVNGRSVWQDSLGGTQVEINTVIGMTGSKAVDWTMKQAYTGLLIGIVDKLIANGGVWVA